MSNGTHAANGAGLTSAQRKQIGDDVRQDMVTAFVSQSMVKRRTDAEQDDLESAHATSKIDESGMYNDGFDVLQNTEEEEGMAYYASRLSTELRFIVLAILVALVSTQLQAVLAEIMELAFNKYNLTAEQRIINALTVSLILVFVVGIVSVVWRTPKKNQYC